MAVLKAASDGAAQACSGRRFQITAARYEKAFCEVVNLHFCRWRRSDERVLRLQTAKRGVNIARNSRGAHSSLRALNTFMASRCATRVSMFGNPTESKAWVMCSFFLSPVTIRAAKLTIFLTFNF